MSILVKGIDMPTKDDIHLIISADGHVVIDGFTGYGNTYEAISVPTPHGELIDRNEVMKSVCKHLCIKGEKFLLPAEKSVFGNIIKAETVIEAEE